MKQLNSLSSNSGFTALELIIVLVVGFSIIALSASKLGQLFSASSTTSAMNSIMEIYTSARSLRGPAGYDEKIKIMMKQAKMIPKALKTTVDGEAIKITNEWDGAVDIKPLPEADGVGFTIEYDNVPTDACFKLTRTLLDFTGIQKITVGKEGNVDIPLDAAPSDIMSKCDATKSKMIFEFRD